MLDILEVFKVVNSNQNSYNLFSPINRAIKTSVSFFEIKGDKPTQSEYNTLFASDAGLILVDDKIPRKILEDSSQKYKTFISVKNPKYYFAKVVNALHEEEKFAKIGKDCNIMTGVYIYPNVTIGDNVTIMPNAVIGGSGFGFVYEEDKPILFPQIGKVVIGNNVSIGSNTCIDRGALGSTIIGNDVKIDNLVHIAHNVEIGDNTCVIANSLVCGSVKIGKNCWIGASSTIREKLVIEDDALIGMSACVLKNVKAGTTVLGNPAKEYKK